MKGQNAGMNNTELSCGTTRKRGLNRRRLLRVRQVLCSVWRTRFSRIFKNKRKIGIRKLKPSCYLSNYLDLQFKWETKRDISIYAKNVTTERDRDENRLNRSLYLLSSNRYLFKHIPRICRINASLLHVLNFTLGDDQRLPNIIQG